jgi:hypothetical protein
MNQFYYLEGEPLGSIWGARFASSCTDLPYAVQSECAQFQVNDDGLMVWVGTGADYQQGISDRLWGTTTNINGFNYTWGYPFKALECVGDNGAANGASPDETCTTTNFVRLGNTTPDFAWSFSTNFRWKNFGVYVLFDSEVGQDNYFQTGQWSLRDNKSSYVDQAGKAEGLKKPTGYYNLVYNALEEASWFVEDGTYVKLRELSLSYTFGREQLAGIFGGFFQRATLQAIGRNLLTFTDYPGFDPEVGTTDAGTGSTVVGRTDSYQYPNYRTMTFMVELAF